MKLRDYQLEGIEAIWQELLKENTSLVVLPTGTGKTELFMALVKRAIEAKPNLKTVVAMGRIDLVAQTERRFRKMFTPQQVGVWCRSLGRKEFTRQITIASIHSAKDAASFGPIDLIIVDEVHRFDQDNGAYLTFVERAMNLNGRLKIVGFTATPFRANGEIFGEGKMFKRVTYRKGVKEMIALGFLAPPKMKGAKNAFDVSALRVRAGEFMQEDISALVSNEALVQAQVDDALSRMEDRVCVAWATANIEHCNMVADHLMNKGELATTVHSKLDKVTRQSNLSGFTDGIIRHMVFVTILSEGFDHPPIDCIVLMRPTRSPVLYVQTVGRGLRISPDKTDCLVLDYGQVIRTLGPIDEPRIRKKGEEKGEAVMKECPECLEMVAGGCRFCPDCDFEFPPPPKPAEKLDRRPDNADILSKKTAAPETIKCGPAEISMHVSKAGNECVKIVYGQNSNLIYRQQSGVAEFFVTNSPWAMERLERRLHDLDADIPEIPFEGSVHVPGTFELVKTQDGKYDRILSVKRISEAPPEDELSFNFGANVKGVRENGLGTGTGNE